MLKYLYMVKSEKHTVLVTRRCLQRLKEHILTLLGEADARVAAVGGHDAAIAVHLLIIGFSWQLEAIRRFKLRTLWETSLPFSTTNNPI